MALEIFAGGFVSASLQVIFDRLASSEIWNVIGGQKASDELLLDLGMKLLVVDAVLDHAEVKQFTHEGVKKWLVKVKNAVYDAEDLLDEISTEALRCKMEAADSQSQTGPTDVLNGFSTWFKALLSDQQSMVSRVKDIIHRLEVLAQPIDFLGLKGGGKKLPQRLHWTSLVDESDVVGRVEIKEEMIKRLFSDNSTSRKKKIDVISIVGMGGAGKTTLAQLLYNDERVQEHFQQKAWICVSEDFSLLKLTKSILQTIGSDTQGESLDLLQQNLRKRLVDQKFLLVLDDVWEKTTGEGEGIRVPLRTAWERLRIPFLAAAEGSKVVVTTRNRNVAKIMHADHIHPLEGLSEVHSWSLFEKLAFEDGESGPYPQLESIGRKIVAKCKGLPLAVKSMGSLLYSKTDPREWEKILESEIWSFKDDEILPSLILSYQDLPLHLKQCFAYCSIFPKDHEFDKESLILLWMAEGLVQFPKSNERMVEVGEQYFDELLSKCFFQKSVTKESGFVMHDLIHDLAHCISKEFCIRFEEDEVPKNFETFRHALHFRSGIGGRTEFKSMEAIVERKCERLRTSLQLTSIPLNRRFNLRTMLSKWRYIRVLSLYYYNLIDLPDSIGELKHLRYLDMSHTKIKKLPDSLCDLYNLQTLIPSQHERCIEWPTRMDKLINLRHLNARGYSEMPCHIGGLRNLEKLNNFVVGQRDGFRVDELGELSNIGGRLEISELQNVGCAMEALGANMEDKKHLDELILGWKKEDTPNDVIQSGVLNNLQPHPNLKQLTIYCYPGENFPNWLGGLQNLVTLELRGCKCSLLPPLGVLPSLKHLSISRMKGIERVGRELFFHEDATSSSFRSLQTLIFENMDNWEEWSCCGCKFLCLQELYLIDCCKLKGNLPKELPSLRNLELCICGQLLEASIQIPAIRDLKMADYGKLQLKMPASGFNSLQTSDVEISSVSQWKQLPMEPHMLRVSQCHDVESLLEEEIRGTPTSSMQRLEIIGCHFSRSLDKVCLPTTLKSLKFKQDHKLEFLLPELFKCYHPSLETIEISGSVTDLYVPPTFSTAAFPRLINFSISDLKGLNSLSVLISEGEPTSLRYVTIQMCADLEYIELPALDSACYEIKYCSKLKLLKLQGDTIPILMQRLKLIGCPQLLFHKDGLTSNLCELEISYCHQLMPQVDWGLQRLSCLTLRGGCQNLESFPEEHLLPSTLTTLQISGFPNLKCLNGRGLQQLTSLKYLCILSCPELQFISQDCPKLQSLTGSGLQHLTSLENLTLWGCPKLQSLKEVVLTSLKQLRIGKLPKLLSLIDVGLQRLTSLETLVIDDCPNLQSLTIEKLPYSLSNLDIHKCPLLEQRCQFKEGQEWDYIAHIPKIFINREPL